MPVCRECGSRDIEPDAPTEDLVVPNHYWAVLFRISNQIPSQAHCDTWLDENGYSDEMALRVARAMFNALWHDEEREAWYTLQVEGKKEKRKYYKVAVLTWYSWMNLEARRNGSRPTPVIRKPERATLGKVARGDGGVWAKALGRLQLQVTRPSFETWLKDTVGLGYSGNTLVVGVANEMVASMLEERMYSLVLQAVQDQGASDDQVAFQVGTEQGRV
jgi:hypothetical protein